MCDSCSHYTHLQCDKSLPSPLYEMLSKHPNNPLVYLYRTCKPPKTECNALIDALKKVKGSLKIKLKKMSTAHTKPLHFIVEKVNSIDTSMQSLKGLVSDMLYTAKNTYTPPQPQSWARRTASNLGQHAQFLPHPGIQVGLHIQQLYTTYPTQLMKQLPYSSWQVEYARHTNNKLVRSLEVRQK